MFTYRMTRALLLLVALFAAMGLAPAARTAAPPRKLAEDEKVAPAAKQAKALKALEGTWVSAERTIFWVIAGGKITWHGTGQPATWEIKVINPAKRPREIDLKAGDESYHGIYEVTGGTLRVCFSSVSAPRPTEFKHRPSYLEGKGRERSRSFQSLHTYKKYQGKNALTLPSDVSRVYVENEALADRRYTSRQLSVFGSVARVRRQGDGYVLFLKTTKDVPLAFSFDKAAGAELAALTAGQNVVVRGRCNGLAKTEWGQEAVVFAGCVLERLSD
jgi:uncharacterized protein (TIGR03067 family)